MGQKVNPIIYRVGKIYNSKSRWFADKFSYSNKILEDYKIRELFESKLKLAGLVKVEIERSVSALKIFLFVAKPGVVIGKGGSNLEVLKKQVEKIITKKKGEKFKINLNVEEVKVPDLSAKLIAERMTDQILKRMPHRRVINQAIDKVMQAGAKGVKIQLSGRINGSEIGRTEKYFKGSVPTQTLRSDIDYFENPILTRSGYVGLKVWIYKKDIL